MARKKTKKKVQKKAAPKKPEAKESAKPAAKPAPAKLEVTPELKRLWFRVRRGYGISADAFSNALSSLTDKEAEMLYSLVRLSLFKGNPAQIIQAHPEMREFVHSDSDRLCMHETYQHLSWRLGKSEPLPKDRAIIVRFRKALKGGAAV